MLGTSGLGGDRVELVLEDVAVGVDQADLVPPPMSLRPPAIRYGALALPWSRSDMMSSFGDSGLPVFQAGHCD